MATPAELAAWHAKGFFERDLPAPIVDAARAAAIFEPAVSGKDQFGSAGVYEFPCGIRGVDMLPLALHDVAIDLL